MKRPTLGLIVFFLGLALAMVTTAKAQVVDTQMLLQAPDAHRFQDFGYSVAVSGTNAVVGAPESALQPGGAYVYSKFGTNWIFQQKLVAIQASTNDLAGISVSIDGTLLAVGAPGFNTNLSTADFGSVYIYTLTNGVWSQQARLTAPDRQRADKFGNSVALSGLSIVVGSPLRSDFGATNNGAIYVYDLTGAGWQLSAKILPNDLTNGSFFGQRVAMSDNTLIAGANLSIIGNTNFFFIGAGAAYVYTRTNVTPFFAPWNLQQKLLPNDFRNSGQFGFSVALDGDTALVGAPFTTEGGTVYAFVRTGSVWTNQALLTPSDLTNRDDFGFSVALQGTRAVIGAVSKDSNNITALGAAYVFTQTNVPTGLNVIMATNTPSSTNVFAGTNIFAPNNPLVATNALANTNIFAPTNALVQTNAFTNPLVQTNVLADTNIFAPTNPLVQTNVFANTNIFATTNPFPSTNAIVATNELPQTNLVAQTNETGATNNGWIEQQELRPLQTAKNFEFGFSVGTGTQGILVGAPAAPIGRGTGAAYIFGSSEELLSIVSATASPSILTPPNRALVPVTVLIVTTGSNVTSKIVSITSNQPDVGIGPNADAPDAIITGDLTALLRAELPDNVNADRVYNLLVKCTDEFGNIATTTVQVVVPHTMGPPPTPGFLTTPQFTARSIINAGVVNFGVITPGTIVARNAISTNSQFTTNFTTNLASP